MSDERNFEWRAASSVARPIHTKKDKKNSIDTFDEFAHETRHSTCHKNPTRKELASAEYMRNMAASVISRANQSCFVYERVMSHMIESYHTYN